MELVFIGFGEAASNLAAGLKSAGEIEIGAFDIHHKHTKYGPLIQQKASETGVKLFDSYEEAFKEARFIICLTSASSALKIAQQVFPILSAGQTYVDMNSTAPEIKQTINALPRKNGVLFFDAAVMGTVPGNRHKVPMLLAGEGAEAFEKTFTPYGMRLTVLNAEPGAASAIKMLKSIVMKGLPQLFLESFEAAEKFGVLETLTDSLADSLNGKTVEQLANTFTARTLIHAKRRSAEMSDVVKTLQGLNVDAGMAKATQFKLDRLAEKDWVALLGPNGSNLDYKETVKFIVKNN